jgi:hypothetical protein
MNSTSTTIRNTSTNKTTVTDNPLSEWLLILRMAVDYLINMIKPVVNVK